MEQNIYKAYKADERVYKTEKTAGKARLVVEIRISEYFAITADYYEKTRNGWECYEAGQLKERILKWFPEFSDFVALHLSNTKGQPMYPVENGAYILRTQGVKACADYLRISEGEVRLLGTGAPDDEDYFKYQLFALGIVDKWEAEAKEAIAHFEALTGKPLTLEEPDNALTLSEGERETMAERIASQYYTPEAVEARRRQAETAKREEERKKIVDYHTRKIREEEEELAIMLAVFDMFGTADNVIFYPSGQEICFNWNNSLCRKHWTDKEIRQFAKETDFCKYKITDNRLPLN